MSQVVEFLCEVLALPQVQRDTWYMKQRQYGANALDVLGSGSWKDHNVIQVHEVELPYE